MMRLSTPMLAMLLGACTATQTTGTTERDLGADGGCAKPCTAGLACVAGECLDLCILAGQVRCDGGCVDPTGDSQNCGGCGITCPSGESCVGARCGGPCAAGHTSCADAGCVDLQGDPRHCGTCDIVCGSSQSCLSGSCQSARCEGPLLACGSEAGLRCVDPSNDPDNCGACGVVCGVEGTCLGGGCACFPGSKNCGRDGGVTCPDLASDPENCGACGAACLRCETCSASSCGIDPFRLGTLLPVPAGQSWLNVDAILEGDFNGDGIADLAAISNGTISLNWSLFWWMGLPDGGFQVERPLEPDSGFFETTAKVADFNGDGVDDLAVLTNQFEGDVEVARRVSVVLGSRTSGFSRGFELVVPDGGNSWNLAVGDVNGDGRPDFVLLGGDITMSSFWASIFINASDGGFVLAAQIPFQDNGLLAIADLNADGRADLVGSDGAAFQLPDGGFGTPVGGYGPVYAAAIDPYGPDPRELLFTLYNGVALWTFGDGGSSLVAFASTGQTPDLFNKAVIADLNGDGIPDVASAGQALGLFFRHGDAFDVSVSDAGFVSDVAVIPGDGGVRIAAGLIFGSAPGVYVSAPGCP